MTKEQTSHSINIRPRTPDLKQKLQRSAESHNRSLAAEIEARLESTFQDEEFIKKSLKDMKKLLKNDEDILKELAEIRQILADIRGR